MSERKMAAEFVDASLKATIGARGEVALAQRIGVRNVNLGVQ